MSMRFRNSSYGRHAIGDSCLKWVATISGEYRQNRANTGLSRIGVEKVFVVFAATGPDGARCNAFSPGSHKRPVHR